VEEVARGLGAEEVVEMEFPKCMKCEDGTLVPLSDYGTDGASVLYKAWVCVNPKCGFSLRIDKGQVTYGRPLDPTR
jgi:hypothetical protein